MSTQIHYPTPTWTKRTHAELLPAVECARQTSLRNAAIVFGIARHVIKRAMLAEGYKPRRPGNFTNADVARMRRYSWIQKQR